MFLGRHRPHRRRHILSSTDAENGEAPSTGKATARRGAVLFDIDGTLVDSNYLHIDAWQQAMVAVGRPVDGWRVHAAMGMDSGKLLEALLGDDAERLGETAKQAHSDVYATQSDRLRTFDGARELLAAVAAHGATVVLATSATAHELETLRRVLDSEDALAEITSSEDVETAKPDPGLVEVALGRAGVPAARAVMIGDTVWDVEAASRAGVRCIGLRSGGIDAAALYTAGAVDVYDGPADLLAHLDTSVLATLWA